MNEEQNPALVSESQAPEEKHYKVSGTQSVLGHEPGSEFTAILTREQEELYTEYGHLEVLQSATVEEGENQAAVDEQQSQTTPTEEE